MMSNDEGCAGLQSAANFLEGVETFPFGDEVERQQAGGGIEGAIGCGMDVAFVKVYASAEGGAKGGGRELQHFRRRVDAIEGPVRVGFGEDLEFKTATGAEDQHAGIVGSVLGKEQRGHALEIRKARDETGWVFSVA
nr:hypothetical protein [Roseimicrobium sp. ORNL1]